MKQNNIHTEDIDEIENEPFTLRVFNTPKILKCLSKECGRLHSVQQLISEAYSIHFNTPPENLKLYGLECDVCLDEEDYFGTHFLDVLCFDCKETSWLMSMKTSHRGNPYMKFKSVYHNNLEHDISIYDDVKGQIGVDLLILEEPKYLKLSDFVDQTPVIAQIINMDCQHYYLKDVQKTHFAGMICPVCLAFEGENQIDRRNSIYRQTKKNCYHEYLELLANQIGLPLVCPRCNEFSTN